MKKIGDITIGLRNFWLCGLIILLVPASFCRADKEDWLDKLNDMEQQANRAREDFWNGDYEQALQQFEALADSVHPSIILYLNECAMCSLAQGDYDRAERRFRQVDALLNTYHNEAGEKRAMSAFGAEAEKVYRGDPYEQAMAYLLLAMLLLDQGDYDNATAACKSGVLADSDASENLFDSDITLLHALQAKCHLLRGEQEAFESQREAASRSVRLTSLLVREDFSARQDLIEILKMSRKERKRLDDKRTDEEIQDEIDKLTAQLDRRIEKMDAIRLLGPLFDGHYNVLILIPEGRCVKKTRTGTDAEMILFKKNEASSQYPDLRLDEKMLGPELCLRPTIDVDFQATTRGGRRMDAILKGKAASRATTRSVGKALTDAGNNAGGYVGLGVALMGGLVQGTAGEMTPDADTRCWQTLPRQFRIQAMQLPCGEHKLVGTHYRYFQKTGPFSRNIVLENESDMAVIVVPPPPLGSYFCPAVSQKLTKRDREGIDKSNTILVTPPTGLKDIVRIDVHYSEGKPILEAIAPDSRQVMRAVRKILKANKVCSALVSHQEVVQERIQLATKHRIALQCHLVGIERNGTRKEGVYTTELAFTLVETQTGNTLSSQNVRGTCDNIKSGPSTAFYRCVEKATEVFLSNPAIRTELLAKQE